MYRSTTIIESINNFIPNPGGIFSACDHNFPEMLLKECQEWKEHIKNTKMAKFD